MNVPDDQQWERAEILAKELGSLTREEAAREIARRKASGESQTVLTLVSRLLDLPPPRLPIQAGDLIGERYTLKEEIGQGGMGTVWRAGQEMIERDVALKMIPATLVSPEIKARFLSEIKVLGRLNHPGIVQIFDAGIHQLPDGSSLPYFTMDLVKGLPLDRWAALPFITRAELLRLMSQVCEAVQSAHERRVVHRDLKPGNILVREDNHPVVLDFGIARLAGAVSGDEAGAFSGTLAYAAPEQHLGQDNDFRSGESVDVYSMGVILYQILSGRRPFEFPTGSSLADVRKIVVEQPAPHLSSVLRDCPALLDEIVARALRKDPADRFYSIVGLGRAIARAALHYGEPTPPRWVPAPDAIVPGTGWKLTEKIGQGGVGEIWLGVHEQLNERRVFKFCDTEEKARTLKRELTLYRLLKGRVGQNPHFVQIHEVSLDEAPWYLMMEYIEAKDLQAWSDAQPEGLASVPMQERVEIVAQVAEALQAAHEAGILHRDIKPANLLVRRAEGAGALHVMVTDFGIGQIVAAELLRGGTRLGFTYTLTEFQRSNLSGTLLYMAPEVVTHNTATVRSDIYSLGVVFWQLLVGDLKVALDADWPARITDPLIRADLARCLAGDPEKRWASAGEFAANLRALPARRDADARRAAELALRERKAYWRGVIGTAIVAAVILVTVIGLARMAWQQRREARLAHGQIALQQAASLPQADTSAGRVERGLALLQSAAEVVRDPAALRTAGAKVLGMPDLIRVASTRRSQATVPGTQISTQPGEACRSASHDGKTMAIASDLDGLNGAVELLDAQSGKPLCKVERKQFPWVPIAEPGLLCFSPDDSTLAIGGAATSRHVLICSRTNGSMLSYLFHASDPVSAAWYPDGRLLAVGCGDGNILVWDTRAAIKPGQNASAGNQFDVPPFLDIPANDFPFQTLPGHKGAVRYLAFAPDGRWLASLDDLGYLRIHTGFDSATRLPGYLEGSARDAVPGRAEPELAYAVEARLERTDEITGLDIFENVVVVRRGAATEEFRFVAGELPAELRIASGIVSLAWSSNAEELCAISLTDIYWLRNSPLEFLCKAIGTNPVGVVSLPDGSWGLAKDKEYLLVRQKGRVKLTNEGSFALKEAFKGQGARTAIASSRDGRVATYRGRRIQFFQNHEAAPTNSWITADGGGGEFKQLLWDSDGMVLGAVFAGTNKNLHLESWSTTTNFPPACQPLATADLECEQLVPANRSRQFIGRSMHRGVFRLDAENGAQTVLDGSNVAQQGYALAASASGDFLAMVVDRNTIRLLKMPEGAFFADLESRRPSRLLDLYWDSSGRHLAGITEDGFIEVWNLSHWQDWLAQYARAR